MVTLTPGGKPGNRLVLADGVDGGVRPRAGFGGEHYRVAWSETDALAMVVIDRRLEERRSVRIPVIDGAIAEICSHPAGGEASFAVAWSERRDGALRYRMSRFGSSGEPLGAPVEVGRSRHGDSGCGLGWAAGRWNVAWSAEDWEDGDARLYVTRFDAGGAIVEQLTAVSAVRASLRPTSVSGVAGGGFTFGLLGRPSGEPLSVVMVDESGEVVRHPAPGELNHRIIEEAVWAGNDSGGALLWTEAPAADAPAAIHLRSWHGGEGWSTPTRIGTAAGAASAPDVRWTGREWGVAWSDERAGLASIRFVRLSGAGRPLEPDVPVAGVPPAETRPAP
jgi:hypothetical protein